MEKKRKDGVREGKEGRDRQTDRRRDGLSAGTFGICKISQALHHRFYTVVYLCGRWGKSVCVCVCVCVCGRVDVGVCANGWMATILVYLFSFTCDVCHSVCV